MSDEGSCFTFGEGIEYVLREIAFPPQSAETFTRDAQIIANAFIGEISRIDPSFRKTFRGLSLGGSYLDGIKINLPDEFDIHVKICVRSCQLQPILVPHRPGFVFLRASRSDNPFVQVFTGEGLFVNRLAVQDYFRKNITAVMPQLQNIYCSRRRAYNLKYTAHGYGVAHSLVATNRHNNRERIKFDFVPVFEFQLRDWPKGLTRPFNDGSSWFAVPRKFFDKPQASDPRSFMLCAPRWERLALQKKQNLKDSLRLMKALRKANHMGGLLSYFLKSVYLNNVQKKTINWNQSPGRILIRMLIKLYCCLIYDDLPFFMAPYHNNLDYLSPALKRKYAKIINRKIGLLIECRDNDCFTEGDLYDLFGVEVEDED